MTDFRDCFEQLKQVGYKGDVSFEFESDDQEVLRTMAYLETVMKEVWKHEI